ncbi:hypothetical protein T10_2155 [Trichinella papuae]|uniref:Uncharacterized protein n=1 Tax=Trichinella papuae TaxID=268474 RepID=A0A0V1N949_9BILA|nr:hypothetical protein T10_2155 [Trichinella papuae]
MRRSVRRGVAEDVQLNAFFLPLTPHAIDVRREAVVSVKDPQPQLLKQLLGSDSERDQATQRVKDSRCQTH